MEEDKHNQANLGKYFEQNSKKSIRTDGGAHDDGPFENVSDPDHNDWTLAYDSTLGMSTATQTNAHGSIDVDQSVIERFGARTGDEFNVCVQHFQPDGTFDPFALTRPLTSSDTVTIPRQWLREHEMRGGERIRVYLRPAPKGASIDGIVRNHGTDDDEDDEGIIPIYSTNDIDTYHFIRPGDEETFCGHPFNAETDAKFTGTDQETLEKGPFTACEMCTELKTVLDLDGYSLIEEIRDLAAIEPDGQEGTLTIHQRRQLLLWMRRQAGSNSSDASTSS